MEYNEIIDLLMDNLRRLIFPEEWLVLDKELSKFELISLIVIDRHDRMIMSGISGLIGVRMSTATGIIDRLVGKGYVERERDESDRRIVTLMLSDKGKSLVSQIKSRVSEYVAKLNEMLTDEERQFLFRIFTRILGDVQGKGQVKPEEAENENTLKKIEVE
jgi:DNA-binding MarR family transcriptional regulator